MADSYLFLRIFIVIVVVTSTSVLGGKLILFCEFFCLFSDYSCKYVKHIFLVYMSFVWNIARCFSNMQQFVAHRIQQPIPKLRIRIFTNVFTYKKFCKSGVIIVIVFFCQIDWLKISGRFKNRSFGIGFWISWAKCINNKITKLSD